MENFMMCRSAFCPACYHAGRPEQEDLFALYKQSKGELILQKVYSRNWYGELHQRGFVPQLFTLMKATMKEVHYEQDCLMCGCGVSASVKYDENAQPSPAFTFIDTQKRTMSIKDWNALVFRWKMKKGGTGFEL